MTALDVNLTEETIFTWGAPPLKFGAGAVDEIGFEMAGYGAERVLIVTDPGIHAIGAPERIADSLSRHGVRVEVRALPRALPRAQTATAETLARHVADSGSDLLVMGAYGHSRLREAILGGTTRAMLEHVPVPVLMMH